MINDNNKNDESFKKLALSGDSRSAATTVSPREGGLSRLRILELVHQGVLTANVAAMLLLEVAQQQKRAASANDVAVIGMSGRFPDAPSLKDLWDNLAAGRDSVREIPATRWDVRDHWNPDPLVPNKTYSKWGSTLEDIDQFDPAFFSMSPREARLMDPQQRLYLMEAWHALEDAGYSDRALDHSDCNVFVGTGAGDYQNLLRSRGVPLEGYTFIGTHPAVLAARISYYLNLNGPSIAVDTSCSSSLMAVHLACEAIREGRCNMALAGGVAVLVTPELHIMASKAGMLSPKGRCRTFDDDADGFVPGESVGVIVLKGLENALADGDHVYGVICGSGANQDGKTNGITSPSGPAQTALQVDTYTRFGIDPAQISYIECHGTGTRLGDPIEVEALTNSFASFTNRRGYCAIGSVKSNFGHTLTAAGIVGLIKILLCMQHRQLVPSLHVEKLNRHLRFEESPFFVNKELRDWGTGTGVPRLAAISSFGFSGTNVHAVIREAPAVPPPSADWDSQWRMGAISAKTESALRDRLTQLSGWLEKEGPRYAWRDITYTLAAGRSHFPVRVAFLARGPGDLRERICEWLSHGSVARTGVDHLEAIADDYRAGREVKWEVLYPGEHCRRIPLPTYPFARERYWVPEPEVATSHVTTAIPQATASGVTLVQGDEKIFRRTIRPDEPLVRDHTVRGRPLLPAAAHLSLVHEAVRKLLGDVSITLSRVVWLRPIFIDESREIQIAVKAGEAGQLGFEIRSAETTGAMQIHSRGEARAVESATEEVTLNEVRARCLRRVDAATLYARFAAEGILYGPRFLTVKDIQHNDGEALATLVQEVSDETLPAGVLDGALQSVAALEWDKHGVYLPFAMDAVHVLRPIPRKSFAYVQQEKRGQCRISIVDPDGNPCVLIQGFSYRELKSPIETRLYVPEWRELKAPQANPQSANRILIITPHEALGLDRLLAQRHAGAQVFTIHLDTESQRPSFTEALERLEDLHRIYFLGGLGSGTVDLASLVGLEHSLDLGVRSLFRLVKVLLQRGYGKRNLRLTVVTNDVHVVVPGDEPRPFAAGIFGLCKSISKEYPSWQVTCLDVCSRELSGAGAESIADLIVKETPQARGDEVVLRGRRRYARILRPAQVPLAPKSPFRFQGTYLILGGAGGIGSELALHLARKVQAKIILLGRHARTPDLDDRIHAIESAGGEVLYLQADATDDLAMSEAVAVARQRFGSIHGAFHSALVLRDGLLEGMDEATFEAVLAPKVQGAVVLARALRHEALDFLVFFSSAQSFAGNPGQANYAAACTFKDAFAHTLQSAGQPVHIINWGYWGEVGIVSDAKYRRRMQAVGVHSIGVEEGMQAIERILAYRIRQAMPLKAERRVLDKFGIMLDEGEVSIISTPETWDPLAGRSAIPTPDFARILRAHEELDALGARMVVRALQEMGALNKCHEEHSTEELASTLSIAPAHLGLWETLLEILAASGYVQNNGGRWLSLPEVEAIAGRNLPAEKRELTEKYPEIRAHAELLWTCVSQYPRLLRGDVAPTEVMFPRSSMELVERIYQGNPVSDHLNALAAQAVQIFAESHSQTMRLRVLEIGAGTGGTSACVLSGLAGHSERLEYTYTDVSQGFLRHGKKRFGELSTYVRFKRLDIEQNLAEQGFGEEQFDVVVATNVLHATRRLRDTIRNVKSLLRPGGRLVLSETTAFSIFATLTFGLLDGWWRWEDGDVRLRGTPLATTSTWERLLREGGFGRVAVLTPAEPPDVRIGQHVMVAEREGSIVAPATAGTVRSVNTSKLYTSVECPLVHATSVVVGTQSTQEQLEAIVAESIATTLGRENSELDPERSFVDYGVDSIVLVELVTSLNSRLGIELKATALFDNPNLRELSTFIASEFGPTLKLVPDGSAARGRSKGPDVEIEILEQLAHGSLTLEETYSRLRQTSG